MLMLGSVLTILETSTDTVPECQEVNDIECTIQNACYVTYRAFEYIASDSCQIF